MAEIGQSHMLRVATVWGTTVLHVKVLRRGQSYVLGAGDDPDAVIPDGVDVSPMPLRAIAGGWEVDARGAINGVLKLRGRDEDVVGMRDAPIPVVPGDYGLLQYGLFSVFFQYTAPGAAVPTRFDFDVLVGLAIVSSTIMHIGGLGLMRALSTPPPLEKPLELTDQEEMAHRFGLHRATIETPPPPSPSPANSAGGGTGVKDPGAKDPKPQGGGQKIAGAEGKAGMKGKDESTQLPGEIRPTTSYGGLSDVLSSDTGNEIKQTLKSIDTVANALGGLNSSTVSLGGGPGTGLKGAGSGGGGNGAGVMFGSGTLNTGWGPGAGGGYGSGTGGPGGAGKGGPGGGGSGGGSGGGNGGGNGSGQGPGEKGLAAAPGGNSGGGLSPEQIRRVVMAHVGALRACYEIEAQKNPNLKGGVTVAWTIDGGGGVTSASLAGTTIQNPRVEGCVVRQVKTWRFPSAEKPTNTSWPFRFAVGG